MGFPFRYFKKRWKLSVLILCLTVLHNECLVYWFDSIRWPQVNGCRHQDSCQTILIVSDPQILGPTTGNLMLSWIGYIDSDR